ncbi:MAG: hypothetical protein HY553_18160 [Elusimicrobia bacterium]|nr:hypothetical protein [Elusimicrobiota bacterium]
MRRFLALPEQAWLALAFILRAAFALKVGSRMIQIDENAFDAAAWTLASTGSLGEHHIMPLSVSYFALFFLGGHHPVLARLGQAALSTATVWLLGRATREATGSETASRLAVAVSAVYPFFIYYSGALMGETIYLFLLVAGVWRLLRGSWAAGGFMLGLSALARPEGAYIWAVIWALGGVAVLRRTWPAKAWALAVLCWALPLAAWCARNRAEYGKFALDVHGGITLLHGSEYFELNEQDTAVAMEAIEREPWYQEAMRLPPVERDEALRRRAFTFMRENPGRVVGQWAAKFVSFWRFYPRTDKVYIENRHSHPTAGAGRWALVAVSLAFEPWLIVLGILGLAALTRRDARLWPVPLFIVGTMGIHILSVSQMRYRLPAMPWLILGACWWLGERLASNPPAYRR